MSREHSTPGRCFRPAFVPVSVELLRDSNVPSFAFDQRPADERAAAKAHADAKRSSRHDVATARHSALLARLDGKARSVAVHHGPVFRDFYPDIICEGCDPGAGYQDDSAEWPCSTYTMLEGEAA